MVAWLEETRDLLEDIQNTLEADPVAGRDALRSVLMTPMTVTRSRQTRGKTVCSPRCRAQRWRRRQVAGRQARESRDQELRALLEAALRTLEGKP